jgi:hypothetical protein
MRAHNIDANGVCIHAHSQSKVPKCGVVPSPLELMKVSSSVRMHIYAIALRATHIIDRYLCGRRRLPVARDEYERAPLCGRPHPSLAIGALCCDCSFSVCFACLPVCPSLICSCMARHWSSLFACGLREGLPCEHTQDIHTSERSTSVSLRSIASAGTTGSSSAAHRQLIGSPATRLWTAGSLMRAPLARVCGRVD